MNVESASNAAKNFAEIVKIILAPRGLEAEILAGHKQIIEDIVSSEKYSLEQKEIFLANYKRIVREYKNCKDIAEKASFDFLKEQDRQNSKTQVDADWLAFFFDKAKLVSDKSMQNIWSSILAEEVNHPDTISRALIHTLSIISKLQAEDFCNLCRFCWFDLDYKDEVHPFIFIATEHEAYKKSNITWQSLKNLEYLGLISCEPSSEFVLEGPRNFRSGPIHIKVTGNPQNHGKISVGNVVFTSDGMHLFNIVDPAYKNYREDIYRFIANELTEHRCTIEAKSSVRGSL